MLFCVIFISSFFFMSVHPSVTKHCPQRNFTYKLHDVHSKNSNKSVKRDRTDYRLKDLGASN